MWHWLRRLFPRGVMGSNPTCPACGDECYDWHSRGGPQLMKSELRMKCILCGVTYKALMIWANTEIT